MHDVKKGKRPKAKRGRGLRMERISDETAISIAVERSGVPQEVANLAVAMAHSR
jgi:hypothetical protein